MAKARLQVGEGSERNSRGRQKPSTVGLYDMGRDSEFVLICKRKFLNPKSDVAGQGGDEGML